MTLLKTSELDGTALDWAVATAQGRKEIRIFSAWRESDRGWIEVRFNPEPKAQTARFDPSQDWSYGGPIIDREKITTIRVGHDDDGHAIWGATTLLCNRSHDLYGYGVDELTQFGPTPLIAAMRCFVESKLGAEVDVPESLAKRHLKTSTSGPSM